MTTILIALAIPGACVLAVAAYEWATRPARPERQRIVEAPLVEDETPEDAARGAHWLDHAGGGG